MTYTLKKLLADLNDLGIPVESELDGKVLILEGFSKSGTAEIYFSDKDNVLKCDTRYDQTDTIESFEDLVNVAFEWWQKSESKGYTIPSMWVESFVGFGLVRKVVRTDYEVI